MILSGCFPVDKYPGALPLQPDQASSIRCETSVPVPAPIVPNTEMISLISSLDWIDRTIYVTRLLLGGPNINGFMRATGAVQRIKKQRMRQVKKSSAPGNEEEELMKETINPKTVKRIRSELVLGMKFCRHLHETIQRIIQELDPSQRVNLASLMEPNPIAIGEQTQTLIPLTTSTSKPTAPIAPVNVSNNRGLPASHPTTLPLQIPSSHSMMTPVTTASPGDPNGSTLRKFRKHKFPEVHIPNVSDIDPLTGKKYSKRDYAIVLLEVIRFRALKEGDYVAAKPASHDLWILARVIKDYPLDCGPPEEFLLLSESKRDSMFRDKVILKDVEDSSSNTISVARSNVLPLPRSYAEASDWGSRCRKGCRVYAMYPMTTSLYSGTVIDNTTYCRGDDDVIVVEFDGDDVDAFTGKLPQYHIPARFVTLIPREFPGSSQTQKKRKVTNPGFTFAFNDNGKGSSKRAVNMPKHKRGPSSDSALNEMLDEMSYGDMNGEFNLDQVNMGFDLKQEFKK
jgi:SGF29 tudor-like domain